MAATTISRPSLTDSTSPSTGDIVNAAFFGTNVFDKVDALFTASLTISRSSSGDIAFTVENASNTAGSDAQLKAVVAGTTAGDPYATFTVTSGSSWSIGADNDASDAFKVSLGTAVGTNEFVITTAGMVLIGDDANANMTVGLTINQGSNDNEIIALKSSDIAHGMTTLTETDTFATIKKGADIFGGIEVAGFTSGSQGVLVRGRVTVADTTKSTAAVAAVLVHGQLKSGTTAGSLGANANIAVFTDNGTTRFILDADGDSHQDVGTAWTNFDDHEDVELLHALSAGLSQRRDPVRRQFSKLLAKHRPALERARIVTFNTDGHHFINWSRFNMLITGAIRQQAMRTVQLERRLAKLEA